MSVEAVRWVLAESPATLSDRLVLIVLAECAHPDGSGAFPSVETIGARARLGRRAVQMALRSLEASGAIERDGVGRRGTTCWRVVLGAQSTTPGAQSTTSRGAKSAPEPSLTTKEPPVAPSPARVPALAPTRRRLRTYRGKTLPPGMADDAVALCEAFAEATGRACRAFDGNGAPSAEQKQIAGAMLTRPHVTVDQWRAAIAATVANPPSWIDDRALQLGDVFGQRAAAHALAAAERAASGEPVRPRSRATPQDYLDLIGGTK